MANSDAAKTTVTDSQAGARMPHAIVLRIVCDIDKFAQKLDNAEIKTAINEIPMERTYPPEDADPDSILFNGQVELHKLKKDSS